MIIAGLKRQKCLITFESISKIPTIVLCSSMLSFPVSIFMYICIVGEFFLGFWMSALIPTHFIFSPIGCACAGPRSRPPVAVTSPEYSLEQFKREQVTLISDSRCNFRKLLKAIASQLASVDWGICSARRGVRRGWL